MARLVTRRRGGVRTRDGQQASGAEKWTAAGEAHRTGAGARRGRRIRVSRMETLPGAPVQAPADRTAADRKRHISHDTIGEGWDAAGGLGWVHGSTKPLQLAGIATGAGRRGHARTVSETAVGGKETRIKCASARNRRGRGSARQRDTEAGRGSLHAQSTPKRSSCPRGSPPGDPPTCVQPGARRRRRGSVDSGDQEARGTVSQSSVRTPA